MLAERVVDLSTTLGGAYCAKLFADAGAEVILAEGAAGHPLRSDDTLFRYLHHGVRSVLRAPSDTALLATADIVVVDRGSGTADPADTLAAHPGLVIVAISPYGWHGPAAAHPATEFTLQADSGALTIRGRPDRPPFQMGGRVTEWVTGVYAAVGGLAAARLAAATGHGSVVDVSWSEVANLTGTMFADLFDALRGRPDPGDGPPPRSIETPSIEPTLDGFVGFNTNTRQQFEDFLVLIERPDLLADPSWAGLGVRAARWHEWNSIVHAWTTTHTTAEIVERAALLRIPVAPVAPPASLLELDHAVQRGMFVADPTGAFRLPRRPWSIDGGAVGAPQPSPALGADNVLIDARLPASASARPAPRRLPLQGVRVVDLTAWWAGPSATAMFAALGADVIHVESSKRPDGMRMAGGAFITLAQWWERSPFFLQANTNKRAVTLDLANPAGRELALQLVATADLVVENFTPRVLESFDLDWPVIHAINPRAVMVRMPAFGLDGPWRDRPGFAQTMEQLTGLAWLTGFADDQPRIQRGPCDPNGGMHAAFAALVALQQRDRTGVGCFVEAPMFEAAVAIAAEPILAWTASGIERQRDGNRSIDAAPQGLYACQGTERWLALSVATDEQWAALIGVVGHPPWAQDSRLTTLAGRRDQHDELDAHIGTWAALHDLDDAVATLVTAGIPAAIARDCRRTDDHPQYLVRGFHETIDHPVVGALPTPTVPFRLTGVETWLRNPAPTLGQHNAEVLMSVGCTEADLAALAAANVIGTTPLGL